MFAFRVVFFEHRSNVDPSCVLPLCDTEVSVVDTVLFVDFCATCYLLLLLNVDDDTFLELM